MPTVAVVLTTYDRNQRLRQALDSVREQTVTPTDICVVDGTSTGVAAPVVEEYSEVKYHQQTSATGPHGGRSEGFELVDADYVQFLDDDDRLRPPKLERQLTLLEERPEVGVAYCGVEYESGGMDLPRESVRGNVLDEILSFDPGDCLMTSTMLSDSSVLERIHPFSNTHGADDIGWRIELARLTEFDYVPERLVVAGEHDDHRGRSWESIAGRREILDRYSDLYDDRDPTVWNSAVAETNQHIARRYLEDNLWSPEAIWHFGKAIYHSPDPDLKDYIELLASLGGRPSKRLFSEVYRTVHSYLDRRSGFRS